MSDTVIQVENLAKQYRLGTVGTGSLAHDLNRWWCRLRGKPDPYLKVTQANDRAHRGDSEYVWALRDISFEVRRGEVLGIIGRNGAGKSTLLKILSRITAPTTGEVRVKGRIGSLLEVGTGFHPELTGRENIFLNGAILGMTKAEIRGKLDEIVDFSGCERYLDTPVKRYSSGMMVRLGFAVAAHLEPEILVVDEVLAVGDAEFQRKCVGKMKDVAEHGRTVLFVSHNMTVVERLCESCCVLDEGRVSSISDTEAAILRYGERHETMGRLVWQRAGSGPPQAEILRLQVEQGQADGSAFTNSAPVRLSVTFRVKCPICRAHVSFDILDSRSVCLFSSCSVDRDLTKRDFEPGLFYASVLIPTEYLREGYYSVSVAIVTPRVCYHDRVDEAVGFAIVDSRRLLESVGAGRPGLVMPVLEWSLHETNESDGA